MYYSTKVKLHQPITKSDPSFAFHMEGTLLVERTTFCSMTGLFHSLPCVEGRKSKDLALASFPGDGLTSVSSEPPGQDSFTTDGFTGLPTSAPSPDFRADKGLPSI